MVGAAYEGSEPGRVVGVIGACGGAGASVVAACLAHGLRRTGERATLVDLDAHGPGLQLLLGNDGARGARWPDLAEARGDVDGAGLVAALPRWGVVPVVSGTASGPPPDDDVVLDVCRGLVRSGETLVLDLPRPGAHGPAVRTLLAGCTTVLVVVPLTLRAAVGARRLHHALREAGTSDVRLVGRAPAPGAVDDGEIEAGLGLPVVATMPRDERLARAVEAGAGPAVSSRSRLGRFAGDLASAL